MQGHFEVKQNYDSQEDIIPTMKEPQASSAPHPQM